MHARTSTLRVAGCAGALVVLPLALVACGGGEDLAAPASSAADARAQARHHPVLNTSEPGLAQMAQFQCGARSKSAARAHAVERLRANTRMQRKVDACEEDRRDSP